MSRSLPVRHIIHLVPRPGRHAALGSVLESLVSQKAVFGCTAFEIGLIPGGWSLAMEWQSNQVATDGIRQIEETQLGGLLQGANVRAVDVWSVQCIDSKAVSEECRGAR